MKNKVRIGLVARCDTGGLGHLSYDFWKHIFEIEKQLVILSGIRDNPYLYPKGIICEGRPTLEDIDEFLKDIDVVLAFETPYNWNVFSEAKKRGIKTVLMPMYEWSDVVMPVKLDLVLCPSKIEYDLFEEPKKFIPVPIDRKEIPFKLRTKAKTFVFNNGSGGTGGRNGANALLAAIPLVKSKDIKFIIHSQVQLENDINDERVEIKLGHSPKRKSLFEQGDVFLFPHMFNGLSLPIQEALSSGMPIISTNIYPHNTYMPKEWFFEPSGYEKGRVSEEARNIDIAILDPQRIADKIDEWANKDITEDSKKADEIAQSMSWEILHKEYIKTFEDLIK